MKGDIIIGQRLVATVHVNGRDIAKIYYHWSAYSQSTLVEARDIIASLPNEPMSNKDLILHLIRFCENRGGGISGGEGSREWQFITALYPNETFKPNPNRSYGLVGISELEMADIQSWSEGDITIDIDDGIVYNTVYFWYMTDEEYYYDMEIDENVVLDIPQINFDLGEIPFEDLDSVIDELPEDVCRDKEGNICQMIC